MGGGKVKRKEGEVVNKASVSMVTSSSRSAKIKLQKALNRLVREAEGIVLSVCPAQEAAPSLLWKLSCLRSHATYAGPQPRPHLMDLR